MKKRLRKKKRVGEFRELGFTVFAAHARTDIESPDVNDDWLEQFIIWLESRELDSGGGSNREATRLYITSYKPRASATEQDRIDVSEWLADCSDVRAHAIAPLSDAWHSTDYEREMDAVETAAVPGGVLCDWSPGT